MMGIYGVTSYAVALRTREIAIRMALGATGAAVTAMVLRFGLGLVGAGTLAGLTLAISAQTVLTRVFFDFPRMDPIAFAGATALLAVVGIAACCIPVRRAVRVHPAVSLRCD